MTFLPVVAREMGVLARRSGSYWVRSGTALAALLILGWLLALTTQTTFLSLGRSIFLILSWVGFAYALVAGIHATSDCISEEKREGTLGLLFLTDLKSYDVVLGKLSAGSLSAAYALLAILPMISLGLLLGGVILAEVGEVALILANTLFFSLTLGVFISTLSRNERRSIFAAAVILFLVTISPFLVLTSIMTLGTFTQFQFALDDVGWLSPIYPMLGLHGRGVGPLGIPVAIRNWSLLFHHLLGWIFLISACWILPRFINDIPGKRVAAARKAADEVILGSGRARNARRARLLDRNAFLWLVSRERGKTYSAWFLVLFFAGLYFWITTFFPNLPHDLPLNVMIFMIVQVTLKLWLTSDACNRLIDDRKAGALELLLSTPLSEREIARGQTLALRRIFAWPVLAILAAEIFLAVLSYQTGRQRPGPLDRTLTYAALASTLALDLWALKWVGLWRSLRGKSIERALAGTLGMVLGVPWIAYGTVYGAAQLLVALGASYFPYRFYLLTWWAISVFWALLLAIPARASFFRHFRECAANRFEAAHAAPLPAPTGATEPRPNIRGRQSFAWTVRRHPVVAILAALALATMLGLTGRRWYWRQGVRAEAHRARSEGFPASVREAESLLAGKAGGKDAAMLLAAAGNPTENDGFTLWETFRYRNGGRFGLQSVSALSEALQRNPRPLEALRQITLCASMRLALTNHINFARYSALGCIDFLAAHQARDQRRAFSSARGMITLIRLLREAGTPASHQHAQDALISLALVLERRLQFSEEQLAALVNDLSALEGDAAPGILGIQRAFVLDRSFAFLQPEQKAHALQGTVEVFLNLTGSREKQRWLAARMYRHGIDVATQNSYPERLTVLADWLDLPPWSETPDAKAPDNQARYRVQDLLLREAEFLARLRVLRTGLAIKRSGPEVPTPVPLDPFSGTPLKTLREFDRIAVYSVGRNRQDDRGRNEINSGAGDIAFRPR